MLDIMIVAERNLKDDFYLKELTVAKSLLELIHEFSKVPKDKKLMYRNQLHSYTLIMKQQKDK